MRPDAAQQERAVTLSHTSACVALATDLMGIVVVPEFLTKLLLHIIRKCLYATQESKITKGLGFSLFAEY